MSLSRREYPGSHEVGETQSSDSGAPFRTGYRLLFLWRFFLGVGVIKVPGATGYLDTNYTGKVNYTVQALEDHNFMYVHFEAPDEAGNESDVYANVQAIEDFDEKVLGSVFSRCSDCVIMILPDYPTLMPLLTHSAYPVTFAIYWHGVDSFLAFDER